MARKKTTPAPAEPTNAPEVAAEPKTQGQTAVTATEADSHKHTSEGVQPESLVTGNNSLSATASIATEPGDENSAGDAGLLDAQPGTGSVVADMQPSVSPNSLEVQIYRFDRTWTRANCAAVAALPIWLLVSTPRILCGGSWRHLSR